MRSPRQGSLDGGEGERRSSRRDFPGGSLKVAAAGALALVLAEAAVVLGRGSHGGGGRRGSQDGEGHGGSSATIPSSPRSVQRSTRQLCT